jgi:hypothetical protein
MKEEDFKEVMEILQYADTADYFVERWASEVEWLDELITDLTPEQEKTLKDRLVECKENILWDCKRYITTTRKAENIPKSRFWWYIDKL